MNQEFYLPLAYLNAWEYCHRRFFLEYELGENADNEHLVIGRHLHRHVDGLLQVQVTAAVHLAGLDPYVGYLHEATRGQPAMVLDLMEEFRPLVADNLILSVISHKEIKPDDFTANLGAYRLSDSGRKQFLQGWERKMNQEFKHPTFGYRCTYRRAIELQARLFSRYLQEGVPYKPLTLR